jgi:hypothetical protein
MRYSREVLHPHLGTVMPRAWLTAYYVPGMVSALSAGIPGERLASWYVGSGR